MRIVNQKQLDTITDGEAVLEANASYSADGFKGTLIVTGTATLTAKNCNEIIGKDRAKLILTNCGTVKLEDFSYLQSGDGLQVIMQDSARGECRNATVIARDNARITAYASEVTVTGTASAKLFEGAVGIVRDCAEAEVFDAKCTAYDGGRVTGRTGCSVELRNTATGSCYGGSFVVRDAAKLEVFGCESVVVYGGTCKVFWNDDHSIVEIRQKAETIKQRIRYVNAG